ncbi:MAG: LysR substrate-binding domain-containing protein [Pseudomonadota bacterium]
MTVVSNAPIFDDLRDVRAFVEVAAQASFSRAAKQLGEPRATVSRRIARLEDRAGVRLFERTTRTVQITQPGEMLLQHAQRILDEIEGARVAVETLAAEPSGRLRITAPIIFGQAVLGPVIAAFVRRYPQATLFLDLTNQRVDLVESGFDVAFRLGPLSSSTLIATRLTQVEAALYCSPAGGLDRYLHAEAPADIEDASLLRLGMIDQNVDWLSLTDRNGHSTTVRVRTRLISSEPRTLLDSARAGLGLAILPTFVGDPLVASGDLGRILPNWAASRSDVYLVTPSARHMRPVVRAFLDFAVARIGRAGSANQR